MDQNPDSKNWFQTLPGILTGAAAVIGSITALLVALLGGKSSEGPKTEPRANAVQQKSVETCAARAGYPLGRWEVRVENATPAGYSNFVVFTTASGGTWLPASGKGRFESSVPLAPAKAVTLTFTMEPGSYSSESELVVSPDGCTMAGTFLDSEGHRGEVVYKWQGESGPR
jgi:hypothetical protein